MNGQRVREHLEALTQTPGVMASALVDRTAGLVYVTAGDLPNLELLAEACSNYWRVHTRNEQSFQSLGGLKSVSLVHEEAIVHVLPCGQEMLLMTVSGGMAMDWPLWRSRASALVASV